MKNAKDILQNVKIIESHGSTDTLVENLAFDSRKVSDKTMFFATRGTQADGHNFIAQAIYNGACAVVCEIFPETIQDGISYFKVENASQALGIAASSYYENPSQDITLVGITGTNGKTTTATLLYNMVRELGYKCGLISTVCNCIDDEIFPATHTTPDSLHLNKLLHDMVEKGCEYCFMEVSSHAVVQERISGLQFAGGVFTNLTHDHLDFHKTFDEYLRAKKSFFDSLLKDAFALTNADDRNGDVMLQNTKASKHTYGLKSMADFRARIIETLLNGQCLNIDGEEIWCKLIGSFNAYNLLAIYATARLLGFEKEESLLVLSRLDAVEGRFQHFTSVDNITAIVDYAHTPDALDNVLTTLGEILHDDASLITVVGCGGDRDPIKRPVMAGIAVSKSDKVVLTSDNPRSEDPEDILDQMMAGVPKTEVRKVFRITSRKEAIHAAVNMAIPGDIILVAGKGHEKYQEIKGVKYPFDDWSVLTETLTIQ
ncbi:MAG: UDP-N-acetylmuramoyl-L-alanyl-D-glutamate--2,6-diaminopimelate ligase [Bacteroidota bacterium]